MLPWGGTDADSCCLPQVPERVRAMPTRALSLTYHLPLAYTLCFAGHRKQPKTYIDMKTGLEPLILLVIHLFTDSDVPPLFYHSHSKSC